jgi:hypothetical protein
MIPPVADRDALMHDLEALVQTSIEPVVRRAGFEWNSSGFEYFGNQDEASALFEAEPDSFAGSFPSLMSDYGDQQVTCIDLWIHFDLGRGTIRADVEGTDVASWLRTHDHVRLAEALGAPTDLETAVRSLSEGLELMLSCARETT